MVQITIGASNPSSESFNGINCSSMASNPKEKSLAGIEEGVDRISDLPDLVLSKILSFLPTKYGIAASVLSTRWKHITPFHAPPINLSFDDCLLLHPDENHFLYDDPYEPSSNSYSKSFVDFVDTTLQNVSCVESMSLSCVICEDDAQIVSWVSRALRLNIRHLVLSFDCCDFKLKSLFSCLNGCTTLSKLYLSLDRDFLIPENFSLPNLKRLEIHRLLFANDNFYQMLWGCPALEELLLIHCDLQDIAARSITSPLLKKLSIVGGVTPYSYITFRAPNLEDFILIDQCLEMQDLKSLVRAYIQASPDLCDDITVDTSGQLVIACSTAASLYLSARTISTIHYSSIQLPVFQNLTCLSIGCLKLHNGLYVLASLLWIDAPNLAKLILEEQCWSGRDEGGYENFELSLPNPPPCLELHIKEIEFWLLKKMEEDEIKLMEYFLKNGKVLEKLVLFCLPHEDASVMIRLNKLSAQSKIFYEQKEKFVQKKELWRKGVFEIS